MEIQHFSNIISTNEFEKLAKSSKFIEQWFHPTEVRKPFTKSILHSMAARYALKTILVDKFREVELPATFIIPNNENGKPYIASVGLVPGLDVTNLSISLSHTKYYAAALLVHSIAPKNIISCGIDIEEVVRFSRYITQPNPDRGFIRMVYTPTEQAQYENMDLLTCYAASFCCKEAVFKALGSSSFNSTVDWKDIELLFPESNQEKMDIHLSGTAKSIFNEMGAAKIDFEVNVDKGHIVFKVFFVQ